MKTALRQGETIIKESPANLQRGIETVGGKLHLTNQRLVFEAHQFNIQGGSTAIDLADIQTSRPCWTRFLGLIPVFPNSLAVFTRDGKEYRFALCGRDVWNQAIEAQKVAGTLQKTHS
jgi:hypothetical protein